MIVIQVMKISIILLVLERQYSFKKIKFIYNRMGGIGGATRISQLMRIVGLLKGID